MRIHKLDKLTQIKISKQNIIIIMISSHLYVFTGQSCRCC